MAPDTQEPDNMSDADLARAESSVPETGATANSMARLINGATTALKNSGNTVLASRLTPNAAYGQGHDMAQLGQGQPHGSTR